MYEFLKDKLTYFVESFRGSETIIWARIQMVIGAAWTVASATDMAQFHFDPKYVAYWIIFNGFVSELIRRNREEWNK